MKRKQRDLMYIYGMTYADPYRKYEYLFQLLGNTDVDARPSILAKAMMYEALPEMQDGPLDSTKSAISKLGTREINAKITALNSKIANKAVRACAPFHENAKAIDVATSLCLDLRILEPDGEYSQVIFLHAMFTRTNHIPYIDMPIGDTNAAAHAHACLWNSPDLFAEFRTRWYMASRDPLYVSSFTSWLADVLPLQPRELQLALLTHLLAPDTSPTPVFGGSLQILMLGGRVRK